MSVLIEYHDAQAILVSDAMLRQALVLLVVVVIFGILVPWVRGFSFLQPWVITAYASMALLFVAPAAAEFWSGDAPPESTRAVLERILALVGYGWGIAVLMLVTSVVTLNLAYWGGRVLIPPQALTASVLVFSPSGVDGSGGVVRGAGAEVVGAGGEEHAAGVFSAGAAGAGIRVAVFAGVVADRVERSFDQAGDHAAGVGSGGGFGGGGGGVAVGVGAGEECQACGNYLSAGNRAPI